MSSLRNVAFMSLSNSIYSDANRRRRDDILSLDNPAKRLGALGVHTLVNEFPGFASKLFRLDLSTPDQPIIGAGGESMVLEQGDDYVLKVIHESALMSLTGQIEFAKTKMLEHQRMRSYLGWLVLPQLNFVARHPYIKNRTAAQILQPRIEIIDPLLFPVRGGPASRDSVCRLTDNHPGASRQLTAFVETSFDLYDKEGLVPDTNGDKNFVLRDLVPRQLVLVDGQPIARDNTPTQTIILRQIESLARTI